jgi:uncharacterized protein YjiS (DUF1127 family)
MILPIHLPVAPAIRDYAARQRYWPLPLAWARATSRLLCLWGSRARERRALARFGERDMRDIGLTPMDIVRECRKPFWRK